MKVHDVVVIGGGMAGIGCARTLAEQHASFVHIAPGLGGSVYSHAHANLGAYLLTPSARRLMPFLRPERLVWLGNTMLWSDQGPVPLFRRALQLSFFRLYWRLKHFRRIFERFQLLATEEGQLAALHRHPELARLSMQRSTALAYSRGELRILREAVDPIVRMCALSETCALSAFEYLHIAMHIDVPVHTFSIDEEMLRNSIHEHYIDDFAVSVTRSGVGWLVKTARRQSIFAHAIVAATGSHAERIVGPHPAPSAKMAKATLWHIRGTVRSRFSDKLHVFPAKHPLYFLHAQGDGSVVVATRTKTPAFKPYLEVEDVLKIRTWEKAFPIGARQWHPQDQTHGLFVIDDYNVVGMEDAYRAGIWAAKSAWQFSRSPRLIAPQ